MLSSLWNPQVCSLSIASSSSTSYTLPAHWISWFTVFSCIPICTDTASQQITKFHQVIIMYICGTEDNLGSDNPGWASSLPNNPPCFLRVDHLPLESLVWHGFQHIVAWMNEPCCLQGLDLLTVDNGTLSVFILFLFGPSIFILIRTFPAILSLSCYFTLFMFDTSKCNALVIFDLGAVLLWIR